MREKLALMMVLVFVLSGCAASALPTAKGAAKAGEFELELSKCQDVSTCVGYILCSDRVHRKFGVEPKKLVCR